LTDWQLVLEAIAAAGWLIETDARMDATRDLTHISAATLLRRRLHTGARSAALNPQLAAEHPLLGAARSAGAATGRLARGDISGTVDRLAWGSAQLGAALGARIAHAELQPDRTSTPWRPSVAPPQPRRPRKRRRSGAARGTVLLYHRVCELPDDPLGVAVSPQHFAEQMAVLVADDRPAALADVVSGAAGPRAVAVTFDDGYVDNLLHALPILQRYSVPATLFASTGHIATGDGFWWDELQRSVEAALSGGEPGPLSLELPSGKRTWRPDVDTPIGSLLDWLHAAIRPLPVAEVAAAVSAIRDWAGVESHPPERDRPLTASELKRLADAGPFDVQAHGRNHLSMAFMDSRTRSDEMVGSADDIESWLGRRPTQFAYPFGVPGVDVDAGSRKDAAAAGFSIAVVNAADAPAGNQHAVPRLAVPDVGGPAFAELIASRAR
jgi:peptidoglycan/xylan/chitin deacetylase (PgdA/CDA1 family)